MCFRWVSVGFCVLRIWGLGWMEMGYLMWKLSHYLPNSTCCCCCIKFFESWWADNSLLTQMYHLMSWSVLWGLLSSLWVGFNQMMRFLTDEGEWDVLVSMCDYIYSFWSEVDIYLNEKKKVKSSSHDTKGNTYKNPTLYWIMGHLYSDLNLYHKRKIKKNK